MTSQSALLTKSTATDASTPVQDLADILVVSLDALAAVGEVEAACRLAGQACVALRRTDRIAARRFDVLLHRLSPKLTW